MSDPTIQGQRRLGHLYQQFRTTLGVAGRDALMLGVASFASDSSRRLLGSDLLILVAHPDDETLGCGGLIDSSVRLGSSPKVVVLSVGDSKNNEVRARELSKAMLAFGLHGERVVTGGFTQGRLSEEEPEMYRFVSDLIGKWTPQAIVATSAWDAHVDHRAVGRVARRLADENGIPCYEFFVWGWLYPRTVIAAARAERRAGWVGSSPWAYSRPIALQLGVSFGRKKAALECYESQIAPSAGRYELSFPPEKQAAGGAISDRLLRYCLRQDELFFPHSGIRKKPPLRVTSLADLGSSKGWRWG